ncbi:MAG: helix-turn-helix transcriptional regulator [Fidelibacterota bacterium]|nr:MAG: helix-turn-helix transcriptional regulator [Candidatus Neomarinimicrobiota bacterium]
MIAPSAAGMSHAARLLKVMGHPARLQILQFVEGGEETVTSIQEHVGLTQAMTSQHLKLLFETGLVHRRRQGTSIFYRVTEDLGQKMLNCLRECPELWGTPSEEQPGF